MERGLVNFEYTKLCFTVGGEATDPKPSKVYQSVRVSFIFKFFDIRMYDSFLKKKFLLTFSGWFKLLT